MPATIATGKDLKKVSVFINKNGQVNPGTIAENVAGDVGFGPANSNRVSAGARKIEEISPDTPKVQVKQCLGCSSPAAEGLDYCNSCKVYIK